MRISDWSSDVCSSDLAKHGRAARAAAERPGNDAGAFLRRDRTARVEMDPLRGHGTVDEDVAIDRSQRGVASTLHRTGKVQRPGAGCRQLPGGDRAQDRKSTRLNSRPQCATRKTYCAGTKKQ